MTEHVCLLPGQHSGKLLKSAALQREGKMIDEVFDAMRRFSSQIFGSDAKRQMRSPFDGIQIL